MNDLQYATYSGIYQAYAYQQGEANRPMEFRCPDQYLGFWGENKSLDVEGFNLVDFFTVVADADAEGCCHYWKIRRVELDVLGGEQVYLMLACTEDDSMNGLSDAEAAEFLWAGHWLRLHSA